MTEFSVAIRHKGARLSAEILLKDQQKAEKSGVTYYFYLLRNGAVIDKKGWYSEPQYQWTLEDGGKYRVQGYVRFGDVREFKFSDEIEFGGAAMLPVHDFFSLASQWAPQFKKDLTSECYQIEGVRGLEFYTCDRLEELHAAVDAAVQERKDQSAHRFWIRSLFAVPENRGADENETYQRLNWVLEEIYSRVSEVPDMIALEPGEIPVTDGGIDEAVAAYYRTRQADIWDFVDAWQPNTIGWVDMPVTLKDAVLTVEAKPACGSSSDMQYLFSLQKDGKPVDSTGWSEKAAHSWHLRESGVYSVIGYLKRGEEKCERRSAAFAYSNKKQIAAFEEFMSSYQAEKTPISEPLDFRYLEHPFSDIVVVSHKKHAAQAVAAEAFAKKYDRFKKVCSTGLAGRTTEVYATGGVRKLHTGETVVFSGATFLRNRIVFGADDLPDDTTGDELLSGYGDYQSVVISDDSIRLGYDYFNFGRWFYYEDPETGLIVTATRYHTILLCLKELGVKLSLDEEKAAVLLSTVSIQFLHQNFTRGMDVSPVCQLESFMAMTLTEHGWSRERNELGSALNRRETFHRNIYRALLKKACREISGQVSSVVADDRYDHVFLDLTGGLDSRLVYAAATGVTEGRDKIRIVSYETKGSDDLPIATEINSIYGFQYDDLPRTREPLSLREGNQTARSLYMGMYYSYHPFFAITKRCDKNLISLNGACGEILARPYMARKYFGTMADGLVSKEKFADYLWSDFSSYMIAGNQAVAESFRKYVTSDLERVPVGNAPEAYEGMYLQYRHGPHFDQSIRYEYGAFNWMPMQSKTAFRLHHMCFHKFKSLRLQFDLIGELDPLLLGIRFDSPKDQEEYDRLRDLLEVEDRRYLKIRVSGEDDMKRWQQATDTWRSRSKVLDNAGYQEEKQKYGTMDQNKVLYTQLKNNFHTLMIELPALRESVGAPLYAFISQAQGDTKKINYLYNKITSLLDQLHIIRN